MDLKVDCIVKPDRLNPHERILKLGGKNPNGTRWLITEDQAIAYIKKQEHTFYTFVKGVRANVIIAIHNGRNYLKTDKDSIVQNNLLMLDTCTL